MVRVQMEPPVLPDGEVTLSGAGHHAVPLSDVEKVRRASVLAYCARVCDPARIAEAADATFADLGRALEGSGPDGVVDLDRALLEATREAAAARIDVPDPGSSGGRLVSRRSSRTCELMPRLLSARSSGRLGAGDRAGVERHLSKCAGCRELEQRLDEAEQAYGALLGLPVAPAAPPAEPFAPGDPEPEVAAGRPEHEVEGLQAEPDSAEPEPGQEPVLPDPGPDPDPDLADAAPPEPEPEEAPTAASDPDLDPYASDHDTEFLEAPAASEDAEPVDEEPLPAPDDHDLAPGRSWHTDEHARLEFTEPPPPDDDPVGESRPRIGRTAIAAMIVAGLVIIGIGLLQAAGDGNGGKSRTARSASAQGASPTRPAQPAAPQPSRAELRIQARLRSLGDRELGPGTVGDDVKALQRLLGVVQTGTYGPLTSYAVGQFQATHGLRSTGVADAATKRKLARRARPPAHAPVPPATEGTQPPGQSNPDGTGTTTPGGQSPAAGGKSTAGQQPSTGQAQPAPGTGGQ